MCTNPLVTFTDFSAAADHRAQRAPHLAACLATWEDT